jgi:hypothetical protein
MKQEIETLKQKVIEKVLADPQKAARLLTLIMREPAKTPARTVIKKTG